MNNCLRSPFVTLIKSVLGTFTLIWVANSAIAGMDEPGFLRQAERALQRGGADTAIEILDKHLTHRHKVHHRAEAHGLACRAYLALAAPDSARRECRLAIELMPAIQAWNYWNNLGVAEIYLENYRDAETAFRNAAVMSRWSRVPRRNLGLVRSFLKDESASISTGDAPASR